MLTIQNLSYIHPDKNPLFSNINLTVNQNEKIALIGNNGSGKTTLLRVIAGELLPSSGVLKTASKPYYIPQILGQYDHLTIAEALHIDQKLYAFHEILSGNCCDANYELLDDDWTIEQRCISALNEWQLYDMDLSRKVATLSGGQKTKIFLAGISVNQPELVLLDEPSNHLDFLGRKCLYEFIEKTNCTLIIVSHDRKLLNTLHIVCELSKQGITTYGGNYDFYTAQKQLKANALSQDIQNQEKTLKKAQKKERETIERQQKMNAQAKKNLPKSGLPKIVANTMRNSAENSTAKIEGVHSEKTKNISLELQELRSLLPETDKMKMGFNDSQLHQGKILFNATGINFTYDNKNYIWSEPLSFSITSGERITISGPNGAGKTTLINIILGNIVPQVGTTFVGENKTVYIDQDYSLINNKLNIYDQAQLYNSTSLQEHEVKIRLNRFLFTKDDWDKPCSTLSGGERMRLILCCLSIAEQSPNIIVLDEPTNNLDIQNIEILTNAINQYKGTLIVISHDQVFLEQMNIERTIEVKH